MGAILGAKSANDATEANIQMAKDKQAFDLAMFREGRGSAGSAVQPLYAGDNEVNMYNAARDSYQNTQALLGTPADQYLKYRNTGLQMSGAIDQGNQVVKGIFDDSLTNQRLGYFSPVADARLNFANTQKQGIYQGLQGQLNQMKALQARQGFTGGDSFSANRMLGSTIGANQAAAGVYSQAQLQNAGDVRQIYDAGQALKLQNLTLPYTRAQQNIAFDLQPITQMQQNVVDAQRPFQFYNLNPNAFRSDPALQIGATPSAAQIALTGIGAANAGIGNAFLQNYLAKQYGGGAAAGAAGGGVSAGLAPGVGSTGVSGAAAGAGAAEAATMADYGY